MKLERPLVSTEWLAENLDHPSIRLFDASIHVRARQDESGFITESGKSAWAEAHIPGANFLEMLADFSDNSRPAPMMMPGVERFSELCGRHGIGDDSIVVIYSAQSMASSARMWWMLRSVGYANAAVLDGGWEKWVSEGRPITSEVKQYPPARFTAHPSQPSLWADKDDVLCAIHNPAVCTINALHPDIYSGQVNRYGRPGHIPGSYNVYCNSLVDQEDGTFLPDHELRQRFVDARALNRRTIIHCGGGVSAGLGALGMTLLGHMNVAIYDGSMVEWCMNPALPLVMGTEPG